MDTPTLRITFGVVAVCVLVLCYGVTYRSTRSAYSGWWCASLAAFVTAALLFLMDGTAAQAVANPLGNTIGVLGAGCVWGSAGSLRGHRPSWWQLAAAPLVVGAVSALSHPDRDVWAGGAWYLAGMALLMSLATGELLRVWRAEGGRTAARAPYRFALASLAAVSAVVSVFYALRTVVFVAVGPTHPVFRLFFGPQVTTLLTLILLVVVTFNMSVLSHEQQASELRERATRDGMTGLLNRTEFLRRAQAEIAEGALGHRCTVVVADLDRFKELNDGHGHDAGDAAILVFAEVCRQVVGGDGLIGRLGGDEFAILLYDDARAEQVVEEIAVRLAAAPSSVDVIGAKKVVEPPTASFGLAAVGETHDVGAVVTRADIALYRAKAAGRACAVRFDGRAPAAAQDYGGRAAG